MHGRWVNFLQEFTFVLKHKVGQQNKVTTLLVILINEAEGFEYLKELYAKDEDFKDN